jgi:hypothetical protein
MVGVATIELATAAMSTRAAMRKILNLSIFFLHRSAILPAKIGL